MRPKSPIQGESKFQPQSIHRCFIYLLLNIHYSFSQKTLIPFKVPVNQVNNFLFRYMGHSFHFPEHLIRRGVRYYTIGNATV
jgi:hypothetical protein